MRYSSSGALGVLILIACGFALGGCPEALLSNSPGDAEESLQANGPITKIDGFDHQGLRTALQGDWLVVRGKKRLFEFTIADDTAKVIDHRFAHPSKKEGKLLLRSATSFGIRVSDGTSYFFGFAVVDGTTYMGQGGAIAFEEGEAFEVSLGAWETLVKTDDGCIF
ncbi:MAG: hypothetical protein QF464_15855, partial [Myxococcota bacterium]|nr:hypothetical protein [Myxococcota bacterium]